MNKKIIMLSTDGLIVKEGSESRKRILSYGEICQRLEVVVMSRGIRSGREKVGNVTLNKVGSFNRWLLWFKAYRKTEKIVRKSSREDLMITTQDLFEVGLIGYLLARKYEVPWQAQVHTDFLNPFFYNSSLLNRIRYWLAKYIISSAGSIRVVSERIKKSLVDWDKNLLERIVVLPIWIEVKNERNSRINKWGDRPVILMVSRITKEKGIDLAIRAVKGLIRSVPDLALVIVGDGAERERLESLSKDLKLENNVFFEGWQTDLEGYYRRADIYLLTSIYEGYARTVLEAMKVGVPVVMTDVGVAREVVRDRETGRVVPVYNRVLLEEALLDLLKNKDKREELGRRGKEEVEKREISFKEYLDKYRKTLDF